ncbi:hypothetical protein M3J09_013146 [Ascochyta lentis]
MPAVWGSRHGVHRVTRWRAMQGCACCLLQGWMKGWAYWAKGKMVQQFAVRRSKQRSAARQKAALDMFWLRR